MRFSERAQRIGESATLRVGRRAQELKAAGVSVIDLSLGEPDFPSPQVAVDAAVEALHRGFTRYTATNGTPQLREALAEAYRQRCASPWTAAQTLISVGAKAALLEAALALFESGDEVVLPSPYWVSLPEQIRFAGATPVFVPTDGSDGFRIHADAVLAAITDATRGVLINAPCNPTGGTISAQDLRKVATACAERGIVLISDETYERFVYDGAGAVSAASLAAELPDTILVIGSFSKTFAMTGWRLGFALGPRPVIDAMGRIQSHATSNPTSFAMSGALAALQHGQAEAGQRILEYERRRDLLIPLLNAIPGVFCAPPAGTFYAFADVSACYRPGCADSLELAEMLLEEARVAVVPGSAFGSDQHIRLSFACSREELQEGVARMHRALAPELQRTPR